MVSKQLSARVGILFSGLYFVAVLFFLYHLFISQFELALNERLSKLPHIHSESYSKLEIESHVLTEDELKAKFPQYYDEVLSSETDYSIDGIALEGKTYFGVVLKRDSNKSMGSGKDFLWIAQEHSSLLAKVFKRFLKTSGLYLFGMVTLGLGMFYLIHRYSVSHVNQIIAEEDEKDRKSHFDPLTNLKNRVQILRDLNSAIESSLDQKEKFALVVLDVDNLKELNDQYGKDRGDKILKYLSMRVRNTLTKRDEFARTGGDEFFILLKSYRGYQHASMVVDRVLNVVSQSAFNVDHQSIEASMSAGISFFPQDGKDSETLIEAGVNALQIAKTDGKSCFRTFDTKINRLVQEKVQVEHRLKQALSREEFRLIYQGLHETDTTLVGIEALLRWELDGEILEPHKFIPMASNGQLLVSIGYWVIEEVFQQISRWRQEGFEPLPVHINISGIQIQDEHLVSIIEVLLQRYNIDPSIIRLDIKEADLYDRRMISTKVLNRLLKLGLKIWIDDIGTGYSSFSTLATIDFEGIKIDGFLTQDLLVEQKARQTVQSLIEFARVRNWTLVAESVETQDQANWYMEHADILFQGHHFSKPMMPKEFTEKLLQVNDKGESEQV